jgi:hypothetical protein
MRYRILGIHRFVIVLMCLAALLGSHLSCTVGQDDVPPLILRVYSVADLLDGEPRFANPATAWPGTGLLQPAADVPSGPPMGMGGGMGGMGGGGMFAVPSEPPQGMGGPGMPGGMSGGGGIGGGDMGNQGPGAGPIFGGSFGGSDGTPLVALLQNLLSDEDRFSYDGLEIYSGLLVARQTAEIHELISQIFVALRAGMAEQRVIKIEWVALSLDAAQIQMLSQVDDPQLLQQLIDNRATAYGTLSALNGHLVYSTSGEHRNLVIGVTPVVGSFQDGLGSASRGVGYQPLTVKPILGWVAQVRPLIPPDPNQPGLLHVGISRTSAPEEAQYVPVIGGPDRGNVSAFQAVGTVKCLPNTWAVVGGLGAAEAVVGGLGAAAPADVNDRSPKHVVLVRWSL